MRGESLAEKLIAIFFLGFSLIYTHTAFSLSFGSFMAPKAGFLPVIAGCAALGLALILVIRAFFQQETSHGINGQKLLFIIIGIFVYILLLKLAGYIAAVFICLLYLLKVSETGGWVYPSLLSAVTAVSFYFIFAKLLGSNLP